MPGTQELTRRIKSIKSTRKVTRAMQMVSAAKMRKAQSATLASRTYAELAGELVTSLSGYTSAQLRGSAADRSNLNPDDEKTASGALAVSKSSALMQPHPEATKILAILISSNRGLVGSFNLNLLAQLKTLEKQNPDAQMELIVLGKKAADATSRLHMDVSAIFPKADVKPSVEDIYPLATQVTEKYASGSYKNVYTIYNHFVSTLVQKATTKQLLPFSSPAQTNDYQLTTNDFLFEPSPELVIEHLIPRILESQLYQAVLESDASEHSSRMVMMKNATEAAGDLIDDLTLTYNQLRQNKITTELSEITAGKIALEK